MMNKTFDFGNGPVPARRHYNGGGWVADTAIVHSKCYIGPNAKVYDNARVWGNAKVCNNAEVFGNAEVLGNAKVFDNAKVYDNAKMFNNAEMFGDSRLYGDARLYDYAILYKGYKASKTPKTLKGFPYEVFICDNIIKVGCKSHSLEEWKDKGAAIIRLEGYSSKQAKDWLKLIVLLAETET